MNRLTQQDILAHQQEVPWPNLYQVEQGLLLCQSMIAIFNDDFLSKEVAMRGGTVHKFPAGKPNKSGQSETEL